MEENKLAKYAASLAVTGGIKEKACGLWKESLAILEAIESPNAEVVRRWVEENC